VAGDGEQVLSRDTHPPGRGFGFSRTLSFFYTSVAFYSLHPGHTLDWSLLPADLPLALSSSAACSPTPLLLSDPLSSCPTLLSGIMSYKNVPRHFLSTVLIASPPPLLCLWASSFR